MACKPILIWAVPTVPTLFCETPHTHLLLPQPYFFQHLGQAKPYSNLRAFAVPSSVTMTFPDLHFLAPSNHADNSFNVSLTQRGFTYLIILSEFPLSLPSLSYTHTIGFYCLHSIYGYLGLCYLLIVSPKNISYLKAGKLSYHPNISST